MKVSCGYYRGTGGCDACDGGDALVGDSGGDGVGGAGSGVDEVLVVMLLVLVLVVSGGIGRGEDCERRCWWWSTPLFSPNIFGG